MVYLVAFLAASYVVLWVTPVVREVGIRTGKVDLPGERKIHTQPMVRLGGVSIFGASLIAWLILWGAGEFSGLSPTQEYEIWGVTIGGLLFFLIGLADDLCQLSATVRLLLQGLVASAAWWAGVRIDFVSLPGFGILPFPWWLSLIITLLWLVGMVNALNWMDGLDGLAAGVAGIAAVILLVISLLMERPAAAIIAATLAGGCLGFLRYNFNPAKIFMGDGGAYFLGFTLAATGVIGVAKVATTLAVLLPFCILAVPIVDMSTVIINRLRRGASPFAADKEHLHHRLIRAGLPHRLSVLFVYALTLWVGSLALTLAGLPAGGTFLAVATGIMGFTTWEVGKRTRWFRRSSPHQDSDSSSR